MTDVTPESNVDLDRLAGDEPRMAAADLDAVDEQLIAQLAGRARAGGLALTGQGGLLAQLTKRLVESHWRARSPITLATNATEWPAGMVGTPATGTGPRRC